MFKLINDLHLEKLQEIAKKAKKNSSVETASNLQLLLEEIRNDIPAKKRISYGRYSIIKKMGLEMYPLLVTKQIDIMSFALEIFKNTDIDQFVRSLAVQLMSIHAVEDNLSDEILQIFEMAATDSHWEMRECSAGFIRKIIAEYPSVMKQWYLKQSRASNAMLRRFASESIRPVADNKWFKKNPDFCFEILENMYEESNDYPRSSVGNNLSDWARHDKERVFEIVKELVARKNKNAFWIANRACRNLIKKEPIRVMNLLGIDTYKYKEKIYHRKDYQ